MTAATSSPWETFSPEERALRVLIAQAWMRTQRLRAAQMRAEDEARRELVVARVPAGYGRSQDLVIVALRGSPARGTLIIDLYRSEVVFHGSCGARVIGRAMGRYPVQQDRWAVAAAFVESRKDLA